MVRWVLVLSLAAGCAAHQPGPPVSPAEQAAYAADGALAQVQPGMDITELTQLLGNPSSTESFRDGPSWWVPNAGAMSVWRTVWRYRGRGRIWLRRTPGMFTLPVVDHIEPDAGERG